MIVGVISQPGTLLASSDGGKLPVCKHAIGNAMIKVWWESGRTTESVCSSWQRCCDVVDGNAHPFKRWEIRSA